MVITILYKIKEAVILLLLLFIFSVVTFSQQKKETDSNNINILNNKLSISYGLTALNSLKFNNYGKSLLKSNSVTTSQFELMYRRKIYKTYGITAGVGIMRLPFNLNYSFSFEQNSGVSGEIDSNIKYNISTSFNIFLLLNKIFIVSRKVNIEIEGGIQFNTVDKNIFPFRIGYRFYDNENDISYEFLHIEFYQGRPCYSIRGNIVFTYKLNKRSAIISGIAVNYSPNLYIAEGQYNFSYLPWESYGNIKLGINYLGMKIGYCYSF